ncbi:MAG TPA: sugar phosphate nucleotidyltransferase [Acidimicrobiales bacterium]|jgi:N-acetyl-alpha-D-muramate 1-phosphate uridylyltransferase|nr:sugar phosphate nucleotidyltransferase [Acidimicrobiales bacterium]
MTRDLAAVVLAAGFGTRLRPLTNLVPKALCPVNNEPLADRAIGACRTVTTSIAINAHAQADQIVERYSDRRDLHVEVERPEALGTAGALGNLTSWIDGRDVLVHNADAWHDADVAATVVDGWDRKTMRLLVVPRPPQADFGEHLYAGVCLLPWDRVEKLSPEPTGLYEVLWRDAAEGELELVVHDGAWFDCGTPQSYLAANLHASGGRSVIAPDAVVGGGAEIVDSVVWPGAVVAAGERLHRVIRAPGGLTVDAGGDGDAS